MKLLAMMLSAAVLAAAQPQKPAATSVPFEELVRRASEAREANHLAEAIELYRQAVRMRPQWAEGWWYLGTMFYELDRYTECLEVFRELTTLNPKGGPAWALLGLCEYQSREYDRALEHLHRGRELGLGDNRQLSSVAKYHTALLLTRFEQFEYGAQILQEFAAEGTENPAILEAFGINALRLPFLPAELPPDRREPVLLAGRGAYLLASRRPAEARKAFDALLERYPDMPNVHYAVGVSMLLENPDAALEHFRREIEISPGHVPARRQIAFEYLKRKDARAGLPFAEEAVKLAPDLFAARNALGRLLLETGEVGRAVQELEQAVKLAPDSPETRFALARAYARAGRKEEAERERAEFLRLDKLRKK